MAPAAAGRPRRHASGAGRGSGRQPVTRPAAEPGKRPARGILDPSTVLLMQRITAPSALPAEPLITTVTLAELSVGPLVAHDERERAARQAHLQQAEADFRPPPFARAAARHFRP